MYKFVKKMKFQMGQTAKDKVTEFVGKVTGFCTYITGCDQYLLQPPVDKDGKDIDAKWYDTSRLELVKGEKDLNLEYVGENDIVTIAEFFRNEEKIDTNTKDQGFPGIVGDPAGACDPAPVR